MKTESEAIFNKVLSEAKLEKIEESFEELAQAGLGMMYGIKLLRSLGYEMRDAKRTVHYSQTAQTGSWAQCSKKTEKLHDDLERIFHKDQERRS